MRSAVGGRGSNSLSIPADYESGAGDASAQCSRALTLVCEHDEGAAIIAPVRCDELLEGCDLAGAQNSHTIIRRINQLPEPSHAALH